MLNLATGSGQKLTHQTTDRSQYQESQWPRKPIVIITCILHKEKQKQQKTTKKQKTKTKQKMNIKSCLSDGKVRGKFMNIIK